MKIRTPIEIIEDGRVLCLVPLGPREDKVAVIWKDDYEFLIKLGISQAWHATGTPRKSVIAYVPKSNGTNVAVARVLMDAKPGQRIRYRDGDPMNLRRENMQLIEFASTKRRDRDCLTTLYS